MWKYQGSQLISSYRDEAMGKRFRLIWTLVAGYVTLGTFATVASAQGPIRVESSQVLVPAVVFDKKLYALTDQKHHKHSLSYLIAHDPHFWDSIAVRGLAAKDFHLFEDGQPREILSVAFEAPDFSIVQDNLGKHPEIIGTGGGRWMYPDLLAADSSVWLPWPQYVIAYVPSVSPAGSCHQIQVKLARPNLIVWARSEYCNTPHPASDPLNGTEFGKQMDDDLTSAQESKIDLKLQAVALSGNTDDARVNIHLAFPSTSLKHEFKNGTLYATIGASGVVYNKDGSVAARFSDFACCDYGNSSKPSSGVQREENLPDQEAAMIPNAYETQMNLPPGEYDIRVVLSDGEKFGRKQIPLIVQNPDQKQPTISEIALCRRIRKVPTDSTETPVKLPGSYTPLVTRGVEFTPTADPHFKRTEMLYAYFEVFDPRVSAQNATKLTAHLKIVDAQTGVLRTEFGPVDAASYIKDGTSRFSIGRGIDLSGFDEGQYQLQIRVTDSTGGSTPWRKANFFVLDNTLKPLEELHTSCSISLKC
jgi:hypothetical protein